MRTKILVVSTVLGRTMLADSATVEFPGPLAICILLSPGTGAPPTIRQSERWESNKLPAGTPIKKVEIEIGAP
jgi:hypothetical protein